MATLLCSKANLTFFFDGGRNITVRGLVLDTIQPTFTQGEVVAVDETGALDVKVMEDCIIEAAGDDCLNIGAQRDNVIALNESDKRIVTLRSTDNWFNQNGMPVEDASRFTVISKCIDTIVEH